MGEGFEVYHIPQQSRREKLRVTTNLFSNQNQNQPPLINATDDSPIIDDCNFVYTHQHQHQHQQQQAVGLSLSNKTHTSSLDLYGSILKGSKFLKPAQQLLDQIFQFHIHPPSPSLMELEAQNLISTTTVDYHATTLDTSKRSTLISLLDQVYKRYKHYYQQIQAVIASFETVSGLSSAAPFANLDLKAMSNNFRCLNNAITDQLQLSVKPQISYRKEELVWSNDGLYGQRSINNIGFVDHQPVWRPQRGLPKRAVTVLRAWLFDHFLHPYPTDTDKQLLAKQTGLSRNQVSNWFINARVRLWKPMVEEVHTLEARQVHKISSHIHEQEEEASPIIYRDPSHRSNQDPPSKRPRNENKYIMERNKEHINFYDNLLSIHGANNGANGNRGVSLTLGLHQNNNAITLSEPFPLNSERFVIDGLDAQNRREIMRGKFLHDFGG